MQPQEIMDAQLPPIDIQQGTENIQIPAVDISAPTTTKTSIVEPLVSQTYIENQMRQMTESITTSIGSMFDKFHQSVEQRFQSLSKEINQLKGQMDLYDLTITITPNVQGPSTSSSGNLTSKIKEDLQ